MHQALEGRAVGAVGIPPSSSLGVVVWFFSFLFLFSPLCWTRILRDNPRVQWIPRRKQSSSGVSPEYCQQISFRHLQKQNKTTTKKKKASAILGVATRTDPRGEGDGGDTGMLLEKQTTRTHKQKTSTQTLIVATERCVLCSAPLRHPTSSTAGAAVEMFPPGWRGGGGTVVRCHFGNVTGEMLPKERKTGAGAAGSVLGNQRAAPALPRSLSGIAVSVVSTWQAT